MTTATTTTSKATAAEAQAARKRFSFGPVWQAAVISGKVKDHDKLIAHAIKLKIGGKSALKGYKFETLREKVAAAIEAENKGDNKTHSKAKTAD